MLSNWFKLAFMTVKLKALVAAIVALLFAVEVCVAADSDARGAVTCMGIWNGSTCPGRAQ